MPRKKRLVDLAKERTVLAEERTILSNIRTWLAISGVVIIVGKVFNIVSWWPLLGTLGVLVGVVLVDDMYKLIKIKRKEKELIRETKI